MEFPIAAEVEALPSEPLESQVQDLEFPTAAEAEALPSEPLESPWAPVTKDLLRDLLKECF